ncbi:hypothetical protein PR202_gb26635 [Eleusine coracana subsp. coracana]|uniref:Uncharacterized protein n=1 Tax=Eleusine coracana subsp. coracana TaxID=191504 RepID=A0AAV5FSD8_ELECO|nr:hypothetical protein PR202_gb26635 [Eleusine coracana subsp. coracana]
MHLSFSLLVGALLLLLTYLVFSQQFAISSPNVVTTDVELSNKASLGETGRGRSDKVVACSTEGPYGDTCELDGDVRVNGTALSVSFVPSTGSRSHRRRRVRAWRIVSYARRNVTDAKVVTVTQQLTDHAAAAAPPPCTVNHTAPAVLFALGGYTGNYWHDFTDVLVPLFVASRRYAGDVVLLVARYNPWWLAKYATLLRRLSSHDVVDLDADDAQQIRCFSHLTVGLDMHREFNIVPEQVPGGQRLTMADFTAFLRDAYALPRAALPMEPPEKRKKKEKPRLLLVHRGRYRRIVNEEEVLRAAEKAGRRADAVVFLAAPGAVLVQVGAVREAVDAMARREFGEPAAAMGLQYLEYSVAAEESTLLEMLGPDHPVIRDPDPCTEAGGTRTSR